MKCTALAAAFGVGLAAMAAAHTGVRNTAVLARMDNMTAMARQMEVLVPMVRGTSSFDVERARAALNELAALSEASVDLFRAPETDPRTEARPEIWENFDDFEGRALELAALARAEAVGLPDTRAALSPVVARIGESCSGCHEIYRLEN
ncbi:cytochrome c [Roseibacterium sp. SDUM158016]|uniref:c-type cytochrome n=1 Tax=Roseicyclus sediminis TaxID=2980997 RepID=UPI0021D07B1D|nr:cytochrome c [Roseibacterium sp. SDUM158016]MCU4652616.1 cytochrome c [Roseibacterium sp. SDUM158016]